MANIQDLYNSGSKVDITYDHIVRADGSKSLQQDIDNVGEKIQANVSVKPIVSWRDIVDFGSYDKNITEGITFSVVNSVEPFYKFASIKNSSAAQVYGMEKVSFVIPHRGTIRIGWWENNNIVGATQSVFDHSIIGGAGTDGVFTTLYKIAIPSVKNSQYTQVVNSIATNGSYSISVTKSSSYSIEAYTSAVCVIDGYNTIDDVTYLHFTLDIVGLAYAPNIFFRIFGDSKKYMAVNEEERFGGLVVVEGKPDTSLMNSTSIVENDGIGGLQFNHNDENLIIDQFDGCANMYQLNANFSGYSVNNKSVQSKLTTSCALKSKSKSVGGHTFKGYCFYNEDGSALPFYESSTSLGEILKVSSPNYVSDSCRYEAAKNYFFQCWIDIDELNGNGISRLIQSGYLRYNIRSSVKGEKWRLVKSSAISQWEDEPVTMKIIERVGNMVCLQMPLVETYSARLCLLGSVARDGYTNATFSNTPVYELTIYNPALLDRENIDPYHKYLSKSLICGSIWRGKKVMFAGDSEYNNGILGNMLARELGANVYDMHYGGHRISIGPNYSTNTGVSSISHSWFYQNTYRQIAMSNEYDAVILTFSSNDSSGDADWNGTIDESKITAVEAAYPTIADILNEDQSTYNSKMSIFNAKSDAEKNSIFGFVGTYCAYIKQILASSPRCKVYICSVPISCSGKLTGTAVADPSSVSETIGEWRSGENADTARTYFEAGYLNKDSQIRAIANRYHAKFVDIRNACGLTYENFIYHCSDGVHWFRDIARNCAEEIVRAMKM